jgi:hypothetical protein
MWYFGIIADLHGQPKLFNHLYKLPDLIRLRLALPRLQAERPRDLRMAINMVAAANPAQFESERFDQPPEFGKPDVSQISASQALPQIISAGARHVPLG